MGGAVKMQDTSKAVMATAVDKVKGYTIPDSVWVPGSYYITAQKQDALKSIGVAVAGGTTIPVAVTEAQTTQTVPPLTETPIEAGEPAVGWGWSLQNILEDIVGPVL